MRARWSRRHSTLLVLLAFCAAFCGQIHLLGGATKSALAAATRPTVAKRVLIIGGSAALGWKDYGWLAWKQGWQGGYLIRAFALLAQQTGTRYQVFDKAIPGLNATLLATRYPGRYDAWLTEIHPDIVVIAWGIMNDTRPRTPLAVFARCIDSEIAQARATGARVWVVTPPITSASYTLYKTTEPRYIQAEVNVAESFRDPNVSVFDLFHRMQGYIQSTGTSYRRYEGDVIHPNPIGHQLAGSLLAAEIGRRLTPSVGR